jgi:hydrogenase maturation protease
MDPEGGRPARVSVVGIGSRFRQDDAAGWEVVARLSRPTARRRLPAGTGLHTVDADPARLVSLWQGTALTIVIDAARAVPARPGRVHRAELGRRRLYCGAATASSHGLGLYDALGLGAALERLPGRLVVYAIEAGDTGFGAGLSPPVRAAVRAVADSVRRDLAAAVRREPTGRTPAARARGTAGPL